MLQFQPKSSLFGHTTAIPACPTNPWSGPVYSSQVKGISGSNTLSTDLCKYQPRVQHLRTEQALGRSNWTIRATNVNIPIRAESRQNIRTVISPDIGIRREWGVVSEHGKIVRPPNGQALSTTVLSRRCYISGNEHSERWQKQSDVTYMLDKCMLR